MKVKRIIANVATPKPAAAKAFYQDILGLEVEMEFDWITMYGGREKMNVQITFASEGGGGNPIPNLSVEVDDLDEALARMKKAKVAIEYGPKVEPWGVRRFFVRDPFGLLVNILVHV